MHFITISRQHGSKGSEIARIAAKELGYNLYDTEAIAESARKMGFLESVKGVDEKPPSLFMRLFTHRPEIALDRLHSVIYELAKEGDAVFLGRGSQILLKSFHCALHVRIIASREKRINELEKRGYSRESAIRAIEHSDRERYGFIQYAFGKNWNDPELYDAVLNTDKMRVETAVRTIVHLARSEEIKSCSVDAVASIEVMALAKRVEAAIIEADLTGGPGKFVSVDVTGPGNVLLKGVVDEAVSKERAEQIVRAISGVRSVDNKLRVQPADRHA